MAQLKDLIVTGPTRLIGEAYGRISSANTVPVVNSNANLAFNASTTIATVGGVQITAKLPAGGYQGPAGTNGKQGPQGPAGSNGTNGTNGTNGKQGPQGPAGGNGTNGKQGPQGPKGAQGPAGNGASGDYLPLAGGTLSGDLRLYSGNYGRKINFGDGDYVYLSEPTDDALKIYAKSSITLETTGGTFTIPSDLGGLSGDQGPQGAQGRQGREGSAGTNATGVQGPQGASNGGGGGVTASTGSGTYYLLGKSGTGAGAVTTVYFNTGVKMEGSNLYATSDARMKNFKGDVDIDLDKLASLPKKYFTWKNDKENAKVNIGTSAQELQKVYPELVSTDEKGYLAVSYEKLSVIALAAVDKLHEENNSLKKENDELKERLRKIEEKLGL